jgi:4-amino-4-deoxy-L-arabinose transferase-like glycosyltransferase
MSETAKYRRYHLLITSISALLFILFLGSVHLFDWDEINFAECAREMLVTGDYSRVQLNFQPFWEKPPLFIWLQVISMKLFGVNEFAARFPNALCGMLTLNLLYFFGRKFRDHRFALLWVLSYASAILPFLYHKSGIIDPWFNLFIFLSICHLLQWFHNNTSGNSSPVWAGIFAGLAVLTKGPVALIIIGLCVLVSWIRLRLNVFGNLKNLLFFCAALLLSGFSWFIYEITIGQWNVVKEFISYQVRLFSTEDSGHEGFFLYHFVILLVGCFPASVFFIAAHKKNNADTPYEVYIKKWMMHLFWVVLILFSIVKTKIVHYSSMCYFPLTYLAADTLYHISLGDKKLRKSFSVLALVLGTLIGLALLLVSFVESFKDRIIHSSLLGDDFAKACLSLPVKWSGFEWIGGAALLLGSIIFIAAFLRTGKIKAIYGLLISSIAGIWLTTLLIIPKIEPYTQGPAIEFYQSLKGKDCYVETIGFKSYAYMFYTDRQPSHNSPAMLAYIKRVMASQNYSPLTSFNLLSLNWMLYDRLDKPAYFAAKITDVESIRKSNPDLKELYRKGGFVFYKRMPE